MKIRNRSQVVDLQSELLSPCSILSGVPLGSILEPFLFVLYINDMPGEVRLCNIILYANDAILFYSAKDKNKIEEILNEELSVISNWICRNSLCLSNHGISSIWD